MQDLQSRIKVAVLDGDEDGAKRLATEGLEAGMSPRAMLEGALMPAMEDIGARFSKGEAYIPELIVAAAAMESAMEVLKPSMEDGARGAGTVMLGTVQGDIHSIGKNLVRMCLEGGGFQVIDIGEDVKTEAFVEAYGERKPDVLGLSALLSSTMQHMREVIDAVRAVDPAALIIVGGAPVTDRFASDINASGYAADAFEAVLKVRELLSAR